MARTAPADYPAAMTTAARLERTRLLLTRLDAELATWLAALASRDPKGHHASKRAVLDRLRVQATDLLGRSLADPPAASAVEAPLGAVHARCRGVEGRAVAVRRVWERFRPMFDQRLDPRAAPLLGAADEVVWSCVGGLISPPPLVFLDARAAPDAFPTQRFPGREEPELAPLLDVLSSLVLPFVRLPVDSAPWDLLPLAHELGHHVLAARGWGRTFQDRLRVHGAEWARWSEEVFADVYSVAALGPWALDALAEHVLDEPAKMLVSSPRYPASAMRLAVMREAWRQLGREAGGWQWSSPVAPLAAADDVSAVVATALAPFDDGAVTDLPFDVERLHPESPAHRAWVAGLLGEGPLPLPVDADLVDARAAACAVFAAFRRLPEPGDPARGAAREALSARALTALAACSPSGTRAAQAPETIDFSAAIAALD